MSTKKKAKDEECCSTRGARPPYHEKELHRVRRIKGQLEGVERMIEEVRYCPDIITQIQAIRAALSSLESKLLEEHLNTCVRDAFVSSDHKDQKEKIDEILRIVRRS